MRHLIFAVVLCFTSPGFARPRPAVDDTALHNLARALVAEADWHQPDYAPIAYVLHKRWQMYCRNRQPVSFAKFITMYSALYKQDTPRKRAIRALPWGPAEGRRGGKRWDEVRQWVEQWSEGAVKDPCPKALHWGGTMDRPQGHWYPVSCGRTRNIFYGVRG